MAPPDVGMVGSEEGAPRRERATYEDLQNVPDDKVAELIDGELHVSPRPARPHAFAISGLSGRLDSTFMGTDGKRRKWLFLIEPEIHFDEETILVPDIAAWRLERAPQYIDTPFFDTVPDWVCEGLSPTTVRHDRFRKFPIYGRFGVKDLWFVSPREKAIETLTLGADGRWIVGPAAQGDVRVSLPPFEDVELVLSPMWGL